MMNGREVFQAICSGDKPDRLPIQGVWPWAETLERWRAEGLGGGVDPHEALGLIGDDTLGLPLNLNMLPVFPIRILKEDTRLVTLVDEFGVTKRMFRSDFARTGGRKSEAGRASSMSQWLGFPVKDLSTWKALYEERFQPRVSERLPRDWESRKAEFVRLSETRWVAFFCFPFFGLFGPLRELMGLEGLAVALAEEPGLVSTILQDLTNFWLVVFDDVLRDVRVDQVTFFEDLCSTRSPLIGPAMVREFLAPGYGKVIAELRARGVRHFVIDTDGNARLLIPELLACGITGLHPCEVNAGMDVRALRTDYPFLCLDGGIDKRQIAQGPDAMARELDRCFTIAWTSGRYTPAIDHGAPPDISWANVRHYANLYRAHCLPPAANARRSLS